ncbi:MAG: hypothetical protein V7L22_12525 [Nostoc sp.]|uniref:hypothetical protein n=1 Tax=Nostoc sp. TaxID=1180 RepID=UPI002FFA93EC
MFFRLLAEVGKRVREKGKRNKKNLSPLTFPLFPPLAKVTFARGLLTDSKVEASAIHTALNDDATDTHTHIGVSFLFFLAARRSITCSNSLINSFYFS